MTRGPADLKGCASGEPQALRIRRTSSAAQQVPPARGLAAPPELLDVRLEVPLVEERHGRLVPRLVQGANAVGRDVELGGADPQRRDRDGAGNRASPGGTTAFRGPREGAPGRFWGSRAPPVQKRRGSTYSRPGRRRYR